MGIWGKRGLALVTGTVLLWPGAVGARDFFLQEGTEIALRLRTSVDTKINQRGDRIICTVEEPVSIDNVEVIAVGSRVQGRIGDIEKPGRFGRPGRLVLTFETIEVPGGGNVPISGSLVDIYDPDAQREEEVMEEIKDLDLEKEGQLKGGGPGKLKRGGSLGAGAGIGAAAGSGVGAAVGLAVGAGVALVWFKGKQVELPAGTGLVVRVDRGVALSVPDMPREVGNGTKP